ncbi:MAG TPA: hypothetical protein VM266_09395 [Solirubrobacteraceae bacterium]|nr:hypothetical protein [Solirubrobacteraceae bacterium]
MKVELLYFDGCPGHEMVLPRLGELMARLGVDAPIELRPVESLEQAQRERFLGSPTLRVDGRDAEPGAAARTDFGLKCRLYATPAGLSRTIPDELLVEALAGGGA